MLRVLLQLRFGMVADRFLLLQQVSQQLVSWSLTSLFSTNMAISETNKFRNRVNQGSA